MDLKNVIERFPNGKRRIAIARLRHRVIDLLQIAQRESGKNQTDLAVELGHSRSAVSQVFLGDGNLRISTLAEYLHGMGKELQLTLVPAGEIKREIGNPKFEVISVKGKSSNPDLAHIDMWSLVVPMVGSSNLLYQKAIQHFSADWSNFEHWSHLLANNADDDRAAV